MKTPLLFVLSAITLAIAHGGATSDPPLTWTIYSGYQSVTTATGTTIVQSCAPGPGCISPAIVGDNNGPYVCGQNATTNCGIHLSSGTYDGRF